MTTRARKPRISTLDGVLGGRIRTLRRALGLSQAALGAKLGITFQQVQKYENGGNRVSALMLIKLSEALAVPVADLLKDIERPEPPRDAAADAARLLTGFSAIRSPELREAVLTLVTNLAGR